MLLAFIDVMPVSVKGHVNCHVNFHDLHADAQVLPLQISRSIFSEHVSLCKCKLQLAISRQLWNGRRGQKGGENRGNGNFRREVSRRENEVNLHRRMTCFSKFVSL